MPRGKGIGEHGALISCSGVLMNTQDPCEGVGVLGNGGYDSCRNITENHFQVSL